MMNISFCGLKKIYTFVEQNNNMKYSCCENIKLTLQTTIMVNFRGGKYIIGRKKTIIGLDN